MSAGKHIRELASFVPLVIAERCLGGSQALLEPALIQREGAILFADISGFTRMAEALSNAGPAGVEELTRVLNLDLGCLVDAISEYGGDILKFAGDALLAVWPRNAGDGSQDPVRRAAACGLEVQRRFQRLPKAAGIKVAVRIAIGAGTVSTLIVGGVDGRWETVATGEAVEQIGEAAHEGAPGEVVLSAEAWEWLRDVATTEPRGKGTARVSALSGDTFPVPAPPFDPDPERAEVLRAFIPASVLAFLDENRGDWMAELRRVSVLFALFPGMTSRTPLDRAQAAMRALQIAVYRYEGTVNKLSADDKGTAALAAFGLPPLAHEDDAARATCAACEIQDRMREAGVRTRIGVATGPVFCGVVGNARRREYTMIGDVVNLAARLMQAADDCVWCDERTQLAAGIRVRFTAMPEIAVKGKTAVVRPFRPEMSEPAASAVAAEFPLVGREEERALLQQRLAATAGGAGCTVLVDGGPGIGKSRLMGYLVEEAGTMNLRVLRGAAGPVDRSTPYFAWREVAAAAAGSTGLTGAERTRRVRQWLEERQLPAVSKAALLNPIFLSGFEDTPETASLPEAVRAAAARELVVRIIAAGVQTDGPCVIVLDDVHWMDSASWALALEVARTRLPLLLVLAGRPIENPPDERKAMLEVEGTAHVQLRPLTTDDSIRIACGRLGVDALPPEVETMIREKAEGNPLFTEELAYTLRDSGRVAVSGGICRIAAHLDSMDLPPTVQAAMTARIDRLPVAQQVALKAASVVGRRFASRVLGEVYPVTAERAALDGLLNELARRDMTVAVPLAPETAYRFRHALMQDTAYSLMLFAQRRQLHRAMAEWMERQPETGESQYPELAHHWSKVVEYGEPDPALAGKAADYCHRSAELALKSFANREAITFLRAEQQLLQLLPAEVERDRRELALQCLLGPALIATLGFAAPEVEQAYLQARELCQAREISLERFHILRGLWNYYEVKGRLRQSHELAQELFEVAGALQDSRLRLPAHRALAENALWLGDFPLAERLLEEALGLWEVENADASAILADTDAGVVCFGFKAWVLWMRGYPDQARDLMDQGLERAKQTRQPHTIALTYQNISMVSQFRRDAAMTRRWAEALGDLARAEGFQMWIAAASIMRGWAVASLGQVAEGVAELRQGLEAWLGTGAVLVVPYYLSLLADVLRPGDEALALLDEARARARESGEAWWLAAIHEGRGRVLDGLGRRAEAEESWREAMALARSQGARTLELRALAQLARSAAGDARTELARLYGWFGEGMDTADLLDAVRVLAEAHAQPLGS